MSSAIQELARAVIGGHEVTKAELEPLVATKPPEVFDLLAAAWRIRSHFIGDRVRACAIISAKTGACSEDCRFCAQSARYRTGVRTHGLVSCDEMAAAARRALAAGASSFGIVTSGGRLDDAEFERVLEAIRRIADEVGIGTCASLGSIDRERAELLREAGLERYNHNLEASRSRYPEVATTHTYDDRRRSVEVVKEAGLAACSGGIFGLGETMGDRLDLFFELRDLGADGVPVNFLMPVEGTPLGDRPLVPPLEALATVAAARLVFPAGEVKLAGGRELHLKGFQSWMFYAGASGFIIGDYLTRPGRRVGEDLALVADLGLRLETPDEVRGRERRETVSAKGPTP